VKNVCSFAGACMAAAAAMLAGCFSSSYKLKVEKPAETGSAKFYVKEMERAEKTTVRGNRIGRYGKKQSGPGRGSGGKGIPSGRRWRPKGCRPP